MIWNIEDCMPPLVPYPLFPTHSPRQQTEAMGRHHSMGAITSRARHQRRDRRAAALPKLRLEGRLFPTVCTEALQHARRGGQDGMDGVANGGEAVGSSEDIEPR